MPLARVEGADWIIWPIGSRSSQVVDLPADFYLRELMELPVGNLEAVATLMRQYGLLFGLELDELGLRDYDPERVADLKAIPPFHQTIEGVQFHGVHRDLINFHVQVAQSAITTWLALQRPGGLDDLVMTEATEELLTAYNAVPTNSPMLMADFPSMLLEFRLLDFEQAVDAALSKFSIGLSGLSERQPTVYSVSFLQLYNHLVEKAEFRQCANEPCGKTFVRQRGRAEFGQHRTSGVLYCTRDCARAQAQRQLRRRRRVNLSKAPT